MVRRWYLCVKILCQALGEPIFVCVLSRISWQTNIFGYTFRPRLPCFLPSVEQVLPVRVVRDLVLPHFTARPTWTQTFLSCFFFFVRQMLWQFSNAPRTLAINLCIFMLLGLLRKTKTFPRDVVNRNVSTRVLQVRDGAPIPGQRVMSGHKLKIL